MSAPAHYRAYKFRSLSSALGASTLDSTLILLLNLVQSILGSGSWTGPDGLSTTAPTGWTCLGSSDGSAGALDGVNRWSSGVPAGATGLPWIVLGHATLGQLLIRKGAATGGAWAGNGNTTIILANSFSGGNATTQPTATAGRTMLSNASPGSGATGIANRLHVIQSSTSLQWIIARNGNATGYGRISTVRDAYLTTGVWPTQIVCQLNVSSTVAPVSDQAATADMLGVDLAGTTQETLAGSALGDMGAAAGPGLGSEWILRPKVYNSATASAEGPRAWGIDDYLVVAAANHLGFPSDAAPEWVVLGGAAFPWNKTALNLSA